MRYAPNDLVVVTGRSESKYGPVARIGVKGVVERMDSRGVWVTFLTPWKDLQGNSWYTDDITQLYKPTQLRPATSSPYARVAARYIAAKYLSASEGGCEAEHSWAWISPSGEFIEVEDHGDWAREKFPNETYAEAVLMAAEYPRKYSPKIYLGLLRASCYNPEGFYDKPPEDLLQRGRVYQIPSEIRLQAEKQGLPTLAMGSWPLRIRLTAAEERFLEARDVAPEIVSVEPDNSWNRRVREIWKSQLGSISLDTRQAANKALMKAGWVKVANSYSLGGQKEPKPAQWEAFFRAVLACWKASNLRPPVEQEELELSISDTTLEKFVFSEAIDRFCSRRLQDEIYEHLLEGRPSPTRQDRYEAQEKERWEQISEEDKRVMYPTIPKPNPKPTLSQEPPREKKRKERYPNRPSSRRVAQVWLEVA